MQPAPPLTNLQRELLDLFATDVPEEDLLAIQRLLARYFAAKATAEMDAFVEREGLTSEDLKRWTGEHERAATDRP